MEGVEFEEENKIYTMSRSINKKPSLADLLVKKGVASDTKQANTILLVCVAVAVIITIILFVKSTKSVTDNVVYELPDEILMSLPQRTQDAIYKNTK